MSLVRFYIPLGQERRKFFISSQHDPLKIPKGLSKQHTDKLCGYNQLSAGWFSPNRRCNKYQQGYHGRWLGM